MMEKFVCKSAPIMAKIRREVKIICEENNMVVYMILDLLHNILRFCIEIQTIPSVA